MTHKQLSIKCKTLCIHDSLIRTTAAPRNVVPGYDTTIGPYGGANPLWIYTLEKEELQK
jgi:hypothetical protein